MGFWALSGVLALYLSNGQIDYRRVKLETCYNVEWAFAAENEEPDARVTDSFVLPDNTYLIGAVCLASPENEGEAGVE